MCSSDVFQAGVTPGARSYRWGQWVPDWPNSLLLCKDKKNAKLSRFNTLLQRQDKWPGTPANYPCSVSKNTMLAGFEIMAGHACSLWARMQG